LFGISAVKMTEGTGAISGTLPFGGVSVAIVYKNDVGQRGGTISPDGFYQMPAVVDGRSYYAADVPSGAVATVRLYDSSGTRWIDVATFTVEYKSSVRRYVERDISLGDVESGTLGGS
ncbi:MAG TPA: hypothetical protein VMV65_10425, partial [Alphaproteobacteria bacterium]|nr:hypothetical protein [Alphaproteobacteria bacterium]